MFYLFFVSTSLGEGIWKIRSFINKLEVIFRRQFGVSKHSLFSKSRAIILILIKKKTRIFIANVTRISAITCTNKDMLRLLSDSSYKKFFGNLCKRGY